MRARQIARAELKTARFETGKDSEVPAWAMLAVVMISVPLVWELFQRDQTNGMRVFRLFVAIAAIACLAGVAYHKGAFRQERTDFTAQLSQQSPSPGHGSRQVGRMGMGP